ncbi:hypothetical protein KDM92_05255 [Undibacterium sp. BYS107W]|uniref:Uncharacterized protein n=1 Tax=Undibacterium baiyunense TaxID=2828731 RepID=A0A941DC44_9BURK|nr:hypothetical protein [Undibacterium baiyunense]
MGKLRNSPAAQTTKLSLSIFCPAQLAVSEVGEGQKQKAKSKATATATATAKQTVSTILALN